MVIIRRARAHLISKAVYTLSLQFCNSQLKGIILNKTKLERLLIMSARVFSPTVLTILLTVSFASQAVVRDTSSTGTTSTTGSTGTTFSGTVGVAAQGSGGAVQGPGGTVAVTAPVPGSPGGAPGSGGGSGGGGDSGKKAPGGAIGGNIKAVDAILNPDKKQTQVQPSTPPLPEAMTQEDLRDILIANSVAMYGYCACPYSINVDGYECGVEAAYYKPGGFRIKCYPQNLKGQDYIFYRKNN